MSSPLSPPLPAKLYFRIGEVAGLVGVEPHVLRYWEREFRSIRPTKSAKGQRVYSRKDVEALLVVKDLLYAQGFTIAGAKKKLQRPPQDAGHLLPREPSAVHAQASAESFGTEIADARATTPSTDGHALHVKHSQASQPSHMTQPTHAIHVSQTSHAGVQAAAHGGPPTRTLAKEAREKLVSLRGEIEELLRELGG